MANLFNHRAHRRTRGRIAAAVAGALLILGAAVAFGVSAVPDSQRSQPVVPAVSVAPTAAPDVPAAQSVTGSAGLLVIDSLALSAPLLNMTVPADGVIDPPTFGDAYVIDGGYGTPSDESSGTVFIALHSGRGTSDDTATPALGNALFDRQSQTPSLVEGDDVLVDGVKFVVTGNRVTEQGSLHDEPDLWDGTHALVIVTCWQEASGASSTENSLTFARRA